MRFWEPAIVTFALLLAVVGGLNIIDKVVQGLEARCDLVAPSGD